jgi:MHS family proline/betaine transporter-like MFS transporter
MSTDTLPAVGPPAAGYRRALVGASVGNIVEWYDFALFAGSATVIASVLTPGGWAGFTTVFAVFAMSCLFRPLGALIIGARADRMGRRSVLAATIVLMAGATVAIGLLPPWSAIGVAAPLCLLALRALQAFSCGGEIGVSVAYLMEFSPAGRRGRYGGWYLSTVGVGIAAGLGATAIVAALMDQDALESWGWRLPFLLALPLGAIGLYIRRRLAESPVFANPAVFSDPAAAGRVAPMAVLREYGPTVRRCFVLACAYSAAFNVWFLFLPSYVTATGASSLAVALSCALVGLLVTAIAAPVFGRLSDRIGRRRVLLGATASLAVLAGPAYLWMLAGSTLALLLGSVVMGVVIGAFVIPAFFSEQFPARVRATGLGLAYGVGSAVVGGTAPVLATVLSRQAPAFVVPGYLVLWAVLALIAVRRSAETVTTG